ncbi:hypothetical protein V1281_006953 [Nitrobacteraceae bacterium AZCC 2161]
MVTKKKAVKQKERLGRVPPGDLRTERLVVRIHPDLMGVLVQRAREIGVNRSTYVEKILINYVTQYEGAMLDNIGKHIEQRLERDLPALGMAPAKSMAQIFGGTTGKGALGYKKVLEAGDEE